MPEKIIDPNVGGTFIINAPPPSDPNELVRGVFGISLKQLIRDIQLNVGGKYDSVYEKTQDKR